MFKLGFVFLDTSRQRFNVSPPARFIITAAVSLSKSLPVPDDMEKFTKKDFELLEKLGEGTFGEVHQGRHRKTGKLVALKRVFVR